MVSEWTVVKAEIAHIKQEGLASSLGDSSSDPVALEKLQKELDHERSLRLSLESSTTHKVSSVDSSEIAQLKIELEKERCKRLVTL